MTSWHAVYVLETKAYDGSSQGKEDKHTEREQLFKLGYYQTLEPRALSSIKELETERAIGKELRTRGYSSVDTIAVGRAAFSV